MLEWYLIVDLAPTLPIRFVNLSYGLRKDTIGVDFSTQRRASFSKRKQLFEERGARYRTRSQSINVTSSPAASSTGGGGGSMMKMDVSNNNLPSPVVVVSMTNEKFEVDMPVDVNKVEDIDLEQSSNDLEMKHDTPYKATSESDIKFEVAEETPASDIIGISKDKEEQVQESTKVPS